MADIFKITGLNGTGYGSTFFYNSSGSFYTEANGGGTSYAGSTLGISVSDKRNPDGSYTVTLGRQLFNTSALSSLTGASSVQITDLNGLDRQTFRLALNRNSDDNSGYFSDDKVYGGSQDKKFTTSTNGVTLNISNITSGLLVNAAGTSISWENASSSSTNLYFSKSALSSTASLSTAIDIQGKPSFSVLLLLVLLQQLITPPQTTVSLIRLHLKAPIPK